MSAIHFSVALVLACAMVVLLTWEPARGEDID